MKDFYNFVFVAKNMQIDVVDFGRLPSGELVKKFVLTNKNNVEVTLINYGATLVGIKCPDKNGEFDDILLGFDDLQGYLENDYFGSTVGRFANRIDKGRFTLDGVDHQLNCNNGENHLHGGVNGYSKKLWDWRQEENGIVFEMISPNGDEKYPGTVNIFVSYTLNDKNELKIVLKAKTDQPTIINLTNHAYVNLCGQKNTSTILNHVLELNSTQYLPVNSQLIPTGEIRNVADDLPYDFTTAKPIGQDIEKAGGYDHTFCLKRGHSFCARAYEETSGRQLEIYTSQPGVQFYTGNALNTNTGKNNTKYGPHSGFALEPQFYPDNPNQPSFQSSVVRPGDLYEHFILWKMLTK